MPSDNYQEKEDQLSTQETLPDVVQLDSEDCTPVKLDASVINNEVPKIEISVPILGNENDDIVYKPKKKHKKKVRFRSVSPKNSNRKPLNPILEQNNKLDIHSPDDKHDSSENNINKSKDTNANDGVSMDETDSIEKNKAIEVTDFQNNFGDSDKTTKDLILNENEIKPLATSISIASEDSDSKIQGIEPNMNDSSLDNSNLTTDISRNDRDSYSNEINYDDSANDVYDIYSLDTSRNNPELTQMPQENESQSSEVSSNASIETSDTDPPKYGVDWVEYKAPELLIDLCVSNNHIFYVDIKNDLYYSDYPVLGLQLKPLKQPADKIAVSPSESVVWVLHKGVVYVALQKSATMWKEVEWLSIARDVVAISVDDTCGWYITSSGHLTLQPNLSLTLPYSYPQSIHCKSSVLQVSAWDGVTWVLTANGSLYSVESWEKKPKGCLKEILLNAVPDIDSIFLGVHQTGWIIDSNGIIRFVKGVTSKTPEGVGKPWEVEASSYFVRQLNQLPKAVLKALNKEKLTTLIRGKQRICLSTSTHGIWFCKTFDNLVYSNQKNIIGHSWDSVIPSGTSSTTKWKFISAAGVLNSQGSVWCLNYTNELFCLNISSNTLETVELPSVSGIRSLVPTPQSLWLLSDEGSIFVRRGITPNSLSGNWWQALDLTQLNSEKITFMSCSSEAAWACTDTGRILIRLGSLCPSSSRKLPQAWIPLSTENEEYDNGSLLFEKLFAIRKKFPLPLMPHTNSEVLVRKVYVGPLGYPVWALDDKCNVYVREGVSNSFPIGTKWILVPELQAKELGISRSAVWLLKHSGKIFRRFGVSEKNPCGDYWKQIPGNMDYLSATEEDDLWGLKEDSMFVHSSYVLNCTPRDTNKKPPVRSISEEDWEDIMAETSDSEF